MLILRWFTLTVKWLTQLRRSFWTVDYTASTPEERLLMYADKFHSKSKPPKEPPYFCTFEWYYNLVQKFGSDKQAKFQALADEFGKPDIALVAGKFGFSIKDVN